MKTKAGTLWLAALALASCAAEPPTEEWGGAGPTSPTGTRTATVSVAPSPTATKEPVVTPTVSPRQDPAAELQRIIDALSERSELNILILVHPRLLPDMAAELATLQSDMRNEGWAPVPSEVAVGSAEELRVLLKTIYDHKPFAGVLLLGEFPYTRMWGYPIEDPDNPGPADYYFMDLDGEWVDENSDGFFDRHQMGAGDRDPEIFVGRVSGHPVTILGESEVEMLRAYLERDHAYRTGALSTQGAAIYATYAHHHYGRVDPSSAAWSRAEIRSIASVFSTTHVFIFDDEDDQGQPLADAEWPAELWLHPNSEDRIAVQAKDRFLELLAGGYDYLSIGIHGWHGGWGGFVTTEEVKSVYQSGGQLPVVVASSSCSTGDISRGDDMGSVLTMCGTLVFFGFAASTEITWEEVVYWNESLPESAVGPAFKMLQDLATPDYDGAVRRNVNWVLLGDPTLTVRPAAP
jgi:hypothetical protein